jgi:oligopeptide/dipeptide ABC transporter ATP-binding protein
LEQLLNVRNLSVTYRQSGGRRLEAVKQANFELGQGEVLGIVGESGAGKSTIGWGILGMIGPPHLCHGEVVVKGRNVLSMGEPELREYRWKDVAMVFQSAMNSLDPVITVGKNMAQLLMDKHVVRSKDEARAYTTNLFRTVGLAEVVTDMYPFELSGGMKQRVSIAMALSTNPLILIADEATTALDTVTQFSVLTLLGDLRKAGKIGGMILISHDLSVQAYMADRVIVMLQGRIVEVGSKEEVFKEPKHPYTQFLVGSLSMERQLKGAARGAGESSSASEGCPFTNACPNMMPRCREKFPEMTRLSQTRSVACYLHER